MTSWQPTIRLRYVWRSGEQVAENCYKRERVLQQEWRLPTDRWERFSADYEYAWRDVAIEEG